MISIVVPVFNEEESISAFHEELSKEIVKLAKEYEIVFVDDGSTDASLEKMHVLAKHDSHIRIFSFRKNQGKAEALTLGFQKAKGDMIFTMDADLQDKPSEMHKLLEKHKEGIEVVSGWRKNRKDKSKMVVISRIFNAIVGKLFDVHLHDYNCGLKLYTKDAARSLRLYGGLHRFIPLLVSLEGFSVDEVAIEHQPRQFGKSKYGFSKVWKDLPDIFTMLFLARYRKRPLHFFGTIGGLAGFVGAMILSYLSVLWLMGESIGRRPLLLLGILLVVAGLQIFFTGFIAELVTNLSNKQETHFSLKYSSDPSTSSG